MRGHGRLRTDEARTLLEHGQLAGGRGERREAGPHGVGLQHLVRQIPLLRRPEASGERRAVRRPQVETTGEGEQVGAGLLLRLGPQLVGPQQQRDVRGVLEVGLPDDPRTPVARAPVVGGGEPLQPEHALAPGGEVPGSGRAHPAEPDHDHVVATHRTPSLRSVADSLSCCANDSLASSLMYESVSSRGRRGARRPPPPVVARRSTPRAPGCRARRRPPAATRRRCSRRSCSRTPRW